MEPNIISVGKAAELLQVMLPKIHAAAEALGIEPHQTISGVVHYTESAVEEISKHLRGETPATPEPRKMPLRIKPLTVRYSGGVLTIGRPAPPEAPKPATLSELTAQRKQLRAQIAKCKPGDAIFFDGNIKGRIAELDSQIEVLVEKQI